MTVNDAIKLLALGTLGLVLLLYAAAISFAGFAGGKMAGWW